MAVRVANKRDGAVGEYIGRPSPLGNPFVIGKDGTREEVIRKYAEWLPTNKAAQDELRDLRNRHRLLGNLTLVCWCAPLACHGDVIAKEIEGE